MQSLFKEHFTYDPETGQLYSSGRAVGTAHRSGSILVKMHGKQYLAHRVIWSMLYGDPVPKYIAHIDGDNANNRLDNLCDEAGTPEEREQLMQQLKEYGVIT